MLAYIPYMDPMGNVKSILKKAPQQESRCAFYSSVAKKPCAGSVKFPIAPFLIVKTVQPQCLLLKSPDLGVNLRC